METHKISSDAIIFGVGTLEFPVLYFLEVRKRGVPVPLALLGATTMELSPPGPGPRKYHLINEGMLRWKIP